MELRGAGLGLPTRAGAGTICCSRSGARRGSGPAARCGAGSSPSIRATRPSAPPARPACARRRPIWRSASRLKRHARGGGGAGADDPDRRLPVDLWPRVALAESAGAELLVSIHNNALPDGINPFTNNGTSVFYNQPRSVPLAPRDPAVAGPPARLAGPGNRPGRPGHGAGDMDAVGAGRGDVHDHAGAGGGLAVARWGSGGMPGRVRGDPRLPSGPGSESQLRRCGPVGSGASPRANSSTPPPVPRVGARTSGVASLECSDTAMSLA